MTASRRGPVPDLRRLIIVVQAIAIHHFTMRRRPRTAEIGQILDHLLPNTGTWTSPRVWQLLEQALQAGLVAKHEITPSLFEWSSTYEDIDVRRTTDYFAERQE